MSKLRFLKIILIAIAFAIIAESATHLTLAAIYQPGETLNPACSPTDVNCGVAMIGGGSIIPNEDAIYDLGSSAQQWRDLYLSGNTLHLGGLSLSAGGDGALVWGGSSIEIAPSATSASKFKFSELTANGTNYVGFKAPGDIAANVLWVLPAFDGENGQVLSTNGSGALSWLSVEPAITFGNSNQFFRGDKIWVSLDTSAVPENGNTYWTQGRFNAALAGKTTDNLVEGSSNQYFTDSRARNALSVSDPLLYNPSIGQFSLSTASLTASGYLTSTDWNIFNNKQTASLANGSIWVGGASDIAAPILLSGDATISNAGALTIANNAVTLAKLAVNAVNSAKIIDGSITFADLAEGSVDGARIIDATITNADVSVTAAIVYSKLNLSNSIVLADLATDSVNSSKIIDGSIVAADLAADSVVSAKVLDGTLTDADISAAAAIALSKLASGSSGQIITANASGTPVYVALSGDAVIDNAGALTIANLAITNAKLAADSVTTIKILDGNITVAKLADSSVTLIKIASDSVDSSKIIDGSITDSDIAGNAITTEKISDGSVANIDLANSAIGLSLGAAGTDADVSGSPASLGGTLTLNLPTASETARGLLSSVDWGIFNNKENAITDSTSATYFRGDKTWQTLDTNVVLENGNVYYTSARFSGDLAAKTTSDLAEGLNLYYTDGRARESLSVSAPLSYNTSTGAFSLAVGNVTAPSNSEITIAGGTGAVIGSGLTIAIPEAGATTRGLISTGSQTFTGNKTFSSAPTFSTMNSGSILFAGAGGLVNQNNPNLFWDNANNRLGVGTASPNARLYVKTSDLTSTPFYIEGQDDAFAGLSGWFYRKPVVIDNTANSVSYSNQQTFVSVNTADLISAGKLQSNCADLRFANTDGATILPHWVEYGCNSAGTGVWVQIPTLPAGITKIIYMYYGNATATSTSNGAGVFTFFDDFPTNQARFYNTEYPNWTVQTGSWIIPSGNYLTNYYGGDMITVNSLSAGVGTAVRAKMMEAGNWKYARLLIGWQDANNYYQAQLSSGGGQLNIQKVVGGTQTLLASINASIAAGVWYEVELRWISSTTLEAQVWNVNGNSLGVAQGAISEGWTGGKFGAAGSSGVSQARFENYTTLQYAPNISSNIGVEESSGAPQQIPFFVVKNQTGKVGIGEANPGAKLSVSGGLAVGSDFDTTSVSDGNAIFSNRLGVGVVSPSNALTFAAGSVIDSQGALSLTTASNGTLSLISNGAGNVDIDSGATGALNIGTGANGKTITLGNTTGATGLVFNSGSGNINFDSNTLYIDTVNNRIGVGTAGPSAALEVVGPNNSAGFKFSTGDVGALAIPFLISGTDIGSVSSNLFKVEMTNNTTGGNSQTIASIVNNDGTGITETLLELQNFDSDTTGSFINAKDLSGNSKFIVKLDGNVGIGTAAPSNTLHIVGGGLINSQTAAVGAAAIQRGLQITAGSLGANDGTIRGLDISATVAGTTNIGDELTGLRVEAGAIDANGTTRGLHIYQPSTVGAFGSVVADLMTLERQGGTLTNALRFVDAGTAKFVLTSAGDVGVGTATPGVKLDVVGNMRLADNSGAGAYPNFNFVSNGVGRFTLAYSNTGNRLEILDQENDNGVVLAHNGGSWTSFSDARLKTNVLDISVLDRIQGFKAVSFDWKNNGNRDFGVIAQDIADAFPELVVKQDDGMGDSVDVKNAWLVSYDKMGALALQGLKELDSKLESLAFTDIPLVDENNNKTFVAKFFDRLAAWFANATNGIGDFFAKKIHTEKICLKKSDNSEYCVNGDDLEAIMQNRGETIPAQVPIVEQSSVEGAVESATENNTDETQSPPFNEPDAAVGEIGITNQKIAAAESAPAIDPIPAVIRPEADTAEQAPVVENSTFTTGQAAEIVAGAEAISIMETISTQAETTSAPNSTSETTPESALTTTSNIK